MIDPTEHFGALRHAESERLGAGGGVPFPYSFPRLSISPTDVGVGPVEPDWLYVLVGMERIDTLSVRGFRIRDRQIAETTLSFDSYL